MALWLPAMLAQEPNPGGQERNWQHLFSLPMLAMLGTTYVRPATAKVWQLAGALGALAAFGPPLVAGVVAAWRSNRRALFLALGLPLISLALPLVRAASIGSLGFSSRYIFVADFCLLILIGAGLAPLARRPRMIAVLAMVALSAVSLAEFRWSYVGRTAWRQSLQRVMAAVRPGDALVVPAPIDAMRLRYFSHDGLPALFVWPADSPYPARVEEGANWAQSLALYPQQDRAGAFSAAALADLEQYDLVWYWQAQADPPLNAGFRAAAAARTITVAPGGEFGNEATVRLVAYPRGNQVTR
jgi:hypothetical protein